MTFTYLTTSVVFKHGPRPESADRQYLQETAKTTAAIPLTQDYRAVSPVIAIPWQNMPIEDLTALLAFFDLVQAMVLPWTATFSDGSQLQVRFAEPELNYTEKYTDVFSCTVKLRRVM